MNLMNTLELHTKRIYYVDNSVEFFIGLILNKCHVL